MRQRKWFFCVLAAILVFSVPSVTWARTQAEAVAEAKRFLDQAINAAKNKQYDQASKWSEESSTLLQREAPDEWVLTESALRLAGLSELGLEHHEEAAKWLVDSLKISAVHRSKNDILFGILNFEIAVAINGTKYGGDSIPCYAQAIDILVQHATNRDAKIRIRVAFNNLSAIHIDRNPYGSCSSCPTTRFFAHPPNAPFPSDFRPPPAYRTFCRSECPQTRIVADQSPKALLKLSAAPSSTWQDKVPERSRGACSDQGILVDEVQVDLPRHPKWVARALHHLIDWSV